MTPGKNNKGPPQLVPSQTAELQAKKMAIVLNKQGRAVVSDKLRGRELSI